MWSTRVRVSRPHLVQLTVNTPRASAYSMLHKHAGVSSASHAAWPQTPTFLVPQKSWGNTNLQDRAARPPSLPPGFSILAHKTTAHHTIRDTVSHRTLLTHPCLRLVRSVRGSVRRHTRRNSLHVGTRRRQAREWRRVRGGEGGRCR